ncbi:hypothetical protein GOBAR_DD13533 [Gossypium barbadense]|nr:hypothetical protein GOBAR_DD13533 [Gossypium barbadense]
MKNGLEVFDFKEEDEISELAADKYLSKLKSPNFDDAATLKCQFLECVARGAAVQRKGMDNIPCVDVDAIDGDYRFDGATTAASLGAVEKEFSKEGNTDLDVSPESKSTSSEQQPDLQNDIHEFELRDSFSEAPSPGKRQVNDSLSNSPLRIEPVDLASDANESMNERSPSSPASDIAADNVSLNGNMLDHCVGNIPVDNIDGTVVICLDYVLYQENCYTGVSAIFSPDGIKIECSTLSDHHGTFSFERGIDDIISIHCQLFQRVGYMTVNLKVLSKGAAEAESECKTSAIEELKFAVFDPRWSEKQEAITSLNVKYLAMWSALFDPLMEMDGDDSPVRESYFPNFDEPFEEVIYPKGDFDAVSISKRDVELLQPETFINDTIIDFYTKYLKNQIQPEERQRFHFFNSFFFRKLADLDKDPSSISDGRAAFLRVHKWTRKLDIFGKDYIFIPVNFNYLWEEWKERHKETSEDLSSKFLNLRFVSLEEEVQTGQPFAYLASGETGFPQFSVITPQACEAPYSSSGFARGSTWNPGISMQGEHKVDTSFETSSASGDEEEEEDDVGIIECNPSQIKMDRIEKQDTDQEQSHLVENVECQRKVFMPASIRVLETSITEVYGTSEDTIKICISSENADLRSKDDFPVLLHQNLGAAVNQLDQDPQLIEKNAEMVQNEVRGDDVRTLGEDLPSEDNSTLSSYKSPNLLLNQLDQDSERLKDKEARGDDVQTINDDIPSEDNSTVSSHQNPSTMLNQLYQDSNVVENKETIDDDVQITSDGMLAELAGQPVAKRMRFTTSFEEKVDS